MRDNFQGRAKLKKRALCAPSKQLTVSEMQEKKLASKIQTRPNLARRTLDTAGQKMW